MSRFVARLAVLCLLLLAGGTTADGEENPFGAGGLRFGYSSNLLPELSRSDAQTAVALWTRELAKQTGYNVRTEMTLFDDLPSLVAAIQNGTIDFVGLGSLDYLRIRDGTPMEPALTGWKGGRMGEEQVLLVHRDSGFTNLGQLKGKTLARLGGSSGEIASLWIDTVLARQGFPMARKHFAVVKEVGKRQAALLPVFFRQVDACVVSRGAWESAAELNPQVGRMLVALANSPEYPLAITCFRSSLTEAQKEEFVRISMKMITTPAGKQMFALFKVDTIVRADSIFLDKLAALLMEHGRYAAVVKRK
jgi:phosphonate transport system substrate-binding protein